jgi:hypothetical protein
MVKFQHVTPMNRQVILFIIIADSEASKCLLLYNVVKKIKCDNDGYTAISNCAFKNMEKLLIATAKIVSATQIFNIHKLGYGNN